MAWKRPTTDTPFYIDWEWWAANDRNYRLYLYEQLCEECRRRFPSPMDVAEVDWVDPETAKVTHADALQMCLRSQCVHDPNYINEALRWRPLSFAFFS